MKNNIKRFLLILCLAISLPASPSSAKEANISDIVVTNTRDHLLVYFTVLDCFTEGMERAIQSGIETSFTFFVDLYRKRGFWWDQKIAGLEFNHSIKYDNLKKIYEIRLREEKNKTVTVNSLEEAKQLMAEVVALKVTLLHSLQKGGEYQIRMMAELDSIRLPFYLHYILFFLSLWDFETDWAAIDFRY